MSGISEIVGEDTIGLIFFRLALKSIQAPVGPVNICLFEISDQILPGNVSLVIAELPQKIGIAQSSDVGLRVKQLIFELLVAD